MRVPEPVYHPENNPADTLVLFSGGASGARYLLEKDRNEDYRIQAGITDRPEATGKELLRKHNIPVETEEKEENYSKELLEPIKKHSPDLIVLSGFMEILKDPVISEYRDRIINIHPADLRKKDRDRNRKYTGADAVYQAVLEGEENLRSTAHIATENVDQGPILAVSEKIPVETDLVETLEKQNPEKLENYSEAVQEYMKWKGDGPALAKAIELYTEGRIYQSKDKILLRDGDRVVDGYYDLEDNEIKKS